MMTTPAVIFRTAKRSALAQADKMAATHRVWVRFYPLRGFNGIAAGKAYRRD